MTEVKAISGPGYFQWNAGGWFGASLGSTAWMVVTSAFLMAFHQWGLALVSLSGFMLILAASILLWNCRDRVYPFTGMILLLGMLAIAVPLVWIMVSSYAAAPALRAMNWPTSRWEFVPACLLAPVLILWFTLLERFALRAHRIGCTQQTNAS